MTYTPGYYIFVAGNLASLPVMYTQNICYCYSYARLFCNNEFHNSPHNVLCYYCKILCYKTIYLVLRFIITDASSNKIKIMTVIILFFIGTIKMKRMSNNMAITAILNLRLETTGEIFLPIFLPNL